MGLEQNVGHGDQIQDGEGEAGEVGVDHGLAELHLEVVHITGGSHVVIDDAPQLDRLPVLNGPLGKLVFVVHVEEVALLVDGDDCEAQTDEFGNVGEPLHIEHFLFVEADKKQELLPTTLFNKK